MIAKIAAANLLAYFVSQALGSRRNDEESLSLLPKNSLERNKAIKFGQSSSLADEESSIFESYADEESSISESYSDDECSPLIKNTGIKNKRYSTFKYQKASPISLDQDKNLAFTNESFNINDEPNSTSNKENFSLHKVPKISSEMSKLQELPEPKARLEKKKRYLRQFEGNSAQFGMTNESFNLE